MATVDYKLIKNFFSKKEVEVLQNYCYNKLDMNRDYKLDSQSFSPAWYNDSLMTSFLDIKLPIVEKESNLKLFPTYAYWRYYVFGAMLKKHTDRPSCEISITACIKKYDNWPLIIEGDTIELKEGEALMYSGCDQSHGRPGIYKGKGMAQVFFHYVNQNGPNKDHAYDQIDKQNK
tara:strand:+ start:1606 stop:2130 length:525 start_codon:yes stop_codon:yes gene_type:complete